MPVTLIGQLLSPMESPAVVQPQKESMGHN
jgi:hypothetical protein